MDNGSKQFDRPVSKHGGCLAALKDWAVCAKWVMFLGLIPLAVAVMSEGVARAQYNQDEGGRGGRGDRGGRRGFVRDEGGGGVDFEAAQSDMGGDRGMGGRGMRGGPGMDGGRGMRGGPGMDGGRGMRGGPGMMGGPGMGGPFGGQGPGGQSRGPEQMFQRFDANGNGVLEPKEVPERMKPFLERSLRDAGLDPSKPIPMDRLAEAMRNRANGGNRGGNDQHANEDNKKPENPQDKKTAETQTPLKVRGFGGTTTTATASARGFGSATTVAAAPGAKPGEAKPAAAAAPAAESSSSTPAPQAEERLKKYADSLLKQYDANRSGALEKDEWSQMSGDMASADKDGNGIITKEELVASLAAYGQGSPSSSRRESGGSGSASGAGGSANGSGSRKSYRALSPRERLPEGLPEWFTRSDKNGDGQVAMAEYASYWTVPKAEEFFKYDKNGDGIITPKECLSLEKR